MFKKIFAIMGATGNIGHIIAEDLLKRGHTVRAFGRDEKKLHQLMIKGAELVIGDFDDVEVLVDGFKDAYAVFCMLPPSYTEQNYSAYQDRVSDAICEALRQTNIKRIVNLSSVGAELAEGTGPIKGLHRFEKKLDEIKDLTTCIHLRPEYFMENLNHFLPMIPQGVIASCIAENLEIPMVATRDIGWKAADFLDSSNPQPHLIFDFVGPKKVTMKHVVEVFGKVFEHPELRYQQISYDDRKNTCWMRGFLTNFPIS